ncbi:MAG: hypothetical protein H6839_13610 [Planctomycetes bacterium]|nr:hypothetical protein [Planctomycetota bacterium]
MVRSLICLCLILLTSGCMAVLGYEPTPAELDAIRRGEDPRANESERKQGSAGESTDTGQTTESPRKSTYTTPTDEPAPQEGTVLRWMDSATLVIEAGDRRETVLIQGASVSEDFGEEQRQLDERMNEWTYGTPVRLTYPVKDDKGEVIFRDEQGRLLATIR